MKFQLGFVIFVTFCGVAGLTRDLKNNLLQKALKNLVKALSKENHLVSFVVDRLSNDKKEIASFGSIASVPHIVSSFDWKSNNFQLNSSAIVLLKSAKYLRLFNMFTNLPSTFSF